MQREVAAVRTEMAEQREILLSAAGEVLGTALNGVEKMINELKSELLVTW
jgi:hypothetical protein